VPVCLIVLNLTTPARSDYVVDTAFCKSIKNDKECVDAIPAGSTIGVRDLRSGADGRLVHFWVKVQNENAAQVAILMTRQGTCYSDAVSLPEEKFKASRSRLRTIWSFVSSLTLADVVTRLGLDIKGEIGTAKGMPVDAKASIAFTKPSEGYRIHTYRNVGCAGTITARAFDSNGEAIPGNNPVKVLTIRE
jgi:hypothetical protein